MKFLLLQGSLQRLETPLATVMGVTGEREQCELKGVTVQASRREREIQAIPNFFD